VNPHSTPLYEKGKKLKYFKFLQRFKHKAIFLGGGGVGLNAKPYYQEEDGFTGLLKWQQKFE
jgi:hypothetical protein